MLSSQIPEFVRDVVATGCNICAVGQEHYLFGDGDLKDEDFERVSELLGDIDARYGERDHLRADIVAYLRSIGRYIDTDDVHAFHSNQ